MIKELGEVERIFVPLPFEHAEDIKHQDVDLFAINIFYVTPSVLWSSLLSFWRNVK